MKGFATGDLDGAYGADIAFREMYTGTGRFEGFKADRLPVQTLWVFTIDIGLAVPKDKAGEFKCWSDLDGKTIFTLPLGWDTGTALRKALDTLGIKYEHKELDLEAVATSLSRGDIVATGVYVTGERSVAPWIQNMLAQIDLVVVNPCPEEVQKLEQAGIPVARVSANAFPEPVGVDEFVGVRIFYGFHTGLNLSEDIVYKIVKATYENIDELASLDPAFSQLKKRLRGIPGSGYRLAGRSSPCPSRTRQVPEGDGGLEGRVENSGLLLERNSLREGAYTALRLGKPRAEDLYLVASLFLQ